MQVNSAAALERGAELRDQFGSWAKVFEAQREMEREEAERKKAAAKAADTAGR